MAALLPLLGITWLFGLFVEFHEVLAYIFILLTSTQVRRTILSMDELTVVAGLD